MPTADEIRAAAITAAIATPDNVPAQHDAEVIQRLLAQLIESVDALTEALTSA